MIVGAIENQTHLSFSYDGESRTVEPHCYGIDTKGHEALRAWQVNKGWRLFHVSEMGTLSDTGRAFTGARPGYNPNDKHMVRIIARL
jgi:predicted DNA-binding transcriptional regulator YafY